ncbi:uncharacterized protein [Zea mays]|uniref:uncharacterized protein n=1 Tax=Zea mays TaxID=4577 RepID=UPI001651FC13|nr:uncharacterized protein LOC118476114 [Zea mays]
MRAPLPGTGRWDESERVVAWIRPPTPYVPSPSSGWRQPLPQPTPASRTPTRSVLSPSARPLRSSTVFVALGRTRDALRFAILDTPGAGLGVATCRWGVLVDSLARLPSDARPVSHQSFNSVVCRTVPYEALWTCVCIRRASYRGFWGSAGRDC